MVASDLNLPFIVLTNAHAFRSAAQWRNGRGISVLRRGVFLDSRGSFHRWKFKNGLGVGSAPRWAKFGAFFDASSNKGGHEASSGLERKNNTSQSVFREARAVYVGCF